MITNILFFLLVTIAHTEHFEDGSGRIGIVEYKNSSTHVVYCLPEQRCAWLSDGEGNNFAEYAGPIVAVSSIPSPRKFYDAKIMHVLP